VLPRPTAPGSCPPDDIFGPAHGTRRVDVENPSGGQVIEKPPDRRQVLFDGRLGDHGAELFDVTRDRDRFDLVKLEVAFVRPVEELFHRARIRRARVAVTDVRGKKFDEAAAGAFAVSANDRGQRIESGPDQRRRRRYLVG
jgi:hypothetical protein